MGIIFERIWAMPSKNTYSIKPIKEFILKEIDNNLLWIDPFANNSKFAKITNDLNPIYDTNYHLDALEFLKLFDNNSVDGVLYDPVYSPRQIKECYDNIGIPITADKTKSSYWSNLKNEIARITKVNGKVISFGWNSGGIGKNNGFEIKKILLVPHGGNHNDTIVTLEFKVK